MKHSFLLIGHRASGKSTLGQALAKRFRLPFTDLDAVIEAAEGASAAELVAKDEAAFRLLETDALAGLL